MRMGTNFGWGRVSTFNPGDEITQRRLVGSLPELFQAFESQWASLWNRHTDVPEGQWDQILEFAKSQLRPVHASPPSYDVETVQRTLRRKSKYAATSLDGVSRSDLLALSERDMAVLCKVFAQATAQGKWPEQVLHGYVRSLAKTPDPTEVGHFRPITVFSNTYRTWSSIAARHWLRALSQVTDPFLCGNTTGGRAAMVWEIHVATT